MGKNERFFGLHFDFHAKADSPVGETTNAEDIKKYIKEIKPDYIQCDCKGHPGIACYPTKVGTTSKNMAADNLRIWVDTVHECGLPIYMHYSGIVDEVYCKDHPEHSFNYDKDSNDSRTNVLDDTYSKELLIPQIKEIITEYGADGIWVDGDCWPIGTTFTDNGYITETMKKYLDENLTEREVEQALREAYKIYLKNYVDEIHAFAPDFEIISNWAYSSYMPEKPEIDVDFLSGDYYSVENSTGIRYEGRCMAAQGKPWDIMTWGFQQPDRAYKSEQQLCQEAAATLMLGGGIEIYNPQNPDGSMRILNLTTLKNLGKFVRARKFNFGKPLCSQIGVFYSAETRYKKGTCYNQGNTTKALQGTLAALLDNGFTADVVLEYQIDGISKYEAVVIPEWDLMSDEIKNKFIKYAENGGNLVVIGAELTTQFTGAEQTEDLRIIMDKTGSPMQIGKTAALKNGIKNMYSRFDLRFETDNAAYKTEETGNGSVTYIPFDLGSLYASGSHYIIRNFLEEVMGSLLDKKVEVDKNNVDISLIKDDDGIILNLLNQNKNNFGMGTVSVYDNVPELYNVNVKVHGKFKQVIPLTDEAESIEVLDDYAIIKLSKLHIHTAFKLITE